MKIFSRKKTGDTYEVVAKVSFWDAEKLSEYTQQHIAKELAELWVEENAKDFLKTINRDELKDALEKELAIRLFDGRRNHD